MLKRLKAKISFFAFFFGIVLFLSACTSTNKEQAHIVASDSSDVSNVLKVDQPAIVVLLPDSIQIEKLKAKDSDAFYAGADDYSFYTSKVMDLADSMKIANFSTDKSKIDFKTTDNKHFLIDRSVLNVEDASWGIYLFNGADTPKINASIDLDRAYLTKYFKK